MASPTRALGESVRLVWGEVWVRWGRFCLLGLLTFAAYAVVIVGLVALRAGAVPNYARTFNALEGLQEVLTLAMPLQERYALFAEQPLLELGYLHPLMGTLEGAYTVTVHVLLNIVLVSALIAAYVLVMVRAFRARGLTARTVTGLGLVGSGSTVGILTAGAATVACCGGPAASAVLTLLGASAAAATFVTEHDQALGAVGVLLMVVSLWMATRLVRVACETVR
jgi:hypothetical protein